MAIAYDNSSSGANKELTSLTVSHTATGSDLYAVIVVGTLSNNTSTPCTTSVTYNGVACTKVAGDGRSLATNRYLQNDTYVIADPPTGANNVVATISASPAALSTSLVVATYTGVTSYNTVNSVDASGTAPSVSITTTTANTYVVGGIAAYNPGSQTVAPGSGITERKEQSAPGNYTNDDHITTIQDKAVAEAGAATFDGTLGTSAGYAITAVELIPSGETPASPGTTNLISWWAFDETGTSDTRVDSHGDNDLTPVSSPGYQTGKKGNAVDISAGSGQHLYVADNSTLRMGDADFTIGVWVYLDTIGADRRILNKWDYGNSKRSYAIAYTHSTTRFGFFLSPNGTSSTSVSANSLGAPAADTWYFVVVWYNAATDRMYIQVNNGTPNPELHYSGTYDNDGRFAVGAMYSSGSAESVANDAWYDEAFIYKRLLTDAERTWLYNSGNGRAYADLTGTGGGKPALYYAMMTG